MSALPTPLPAPVSVSVPTAAACLGISARKAWQLVREGRIPAFRIGARVLVKYTSLIEFVEAHANTSGEIVRPVQAESLRARNLKRSADRRAKAQEVRA